MNDGMKMFLRKLLNKGITQKIYTKLGYIQAQKRSSLSDEEYIKLRFRETVGYELDLENPKTLNEKLNWLKLHCKKDEYTAYVDKFAVKKIVEDKIGKEYVIPLLGAWDSFDDIDFDALPNQFVLKCTHDSGGQIICTDKSKLNISDARKKIEDSLSFDYYSFSREYPYKNVKRKIIAEEYIKELGHPDSIEYKLTVMNGKVKFITVCKGIAHDSFDARTNDHYDVNGNILPFYAYYKNSVPPVKLPEQTEEMIIVAEKLAADMIYARVDFYIINGKVLFGEITFFTWGGMIKFTPSEWDQILGDWLVLPDGGDA